jgi:hypothetical protein
VIKAVTGTPRGRAHLIKAIKVKAMGEVMGHGIPDCDYVVGDRWVKP